MNTTLDQKEIISQKPSSEKLRSSVLESFVHHIDISSSMIQDILFFLYPKLEAEVDKSNEDNAAYFKNFVKCHSGIDIDDKFIEDLDLNKINNIFLQTDREIDVKNIHQFLRDYNAIISNLLALRQFKKSKIKIEQNLLSDNPFDTYSSFESLIDTSYLIFTINKRKLPTPFQCQGEKIETYSVLMFKIMGARFEAYSVFFEKYKNEFYKLVYDPASEITSKVVDNNLTLIFINKLKIQEIFDNIKLTESEQKILDCFLSTGLLDNGNYPVPFTKVRTEDIVDTKLTFLLEQLYKNIWVNTKVDGELKSIGTRNYKDRKVIAKLKSELIQYYTIAFDVMQRDESANNIENFQEIDLFPQDDISIQSYSHQEFHNGDNQATKDEKNQETSSEISSISIYLNEFEFREYCASTPEHIQSKIQTILNYILSGDIIETDNLGKVQHAMKYDSSLPLITNQCSAMKFGGKLYPKSLKLNLNRGNRLLLYISENHKLNIQFIGAQSYHNTRRL
jgi:hypothetical protein